MSLIEQINEDIKKSIKNKDMVRLNTLRMLKAKIQTIDPRANLPDNEVIKIFKTYEKNLKDVLEQAKETNRMDIAEKLEKELIIIQEFLPKTLSEEETKKIVVQAINDTGAKTKKDTGLVMKTIMKQNLPIDTRLVKSLVDQLLSE